MANPFKPDTPEYYSRQRTHIRRFRESYVPYIDATARDFYEGRRPHDPRRQEVVHAATLAGRVVSRLGITVAMTPPPVFASSTHPLYGLAAFAFAHENEVFRGVGGISAPTPYELTLDAVTTADAILSEQEQEARRRRQSPFYWFDRLLRRVLGFPAYLISLVFGFELAELSSRKARGVWLASIVADVLGIAAAGAQLGWWQS